MLGVTDLSTSVRIVFLALRMEADHCQEWWMNE